MANLNDLSRQLESIKKQIPFATARAMTSVVRQIGDAQKTAMSRRLDNPTPFTVNSVRAAGATKNNLVARLYVMDTAAAYLTPFETGGVHHLSSSALLNPKNIRLNKYGNLPRTKLAQLKGKTNTFIGDVQGVNGVWRRKNFKVPKSRRLMSRGSDGVMTQVGWKKRKRSKNGTRQPRHKTRPPKLLLRFGEALPVQPIMGYMVRAESMARALMPAALSASINQVLRTAK